MIILSSPCADVNARRLLGASDHVNDHVNRHSTPNLLASRVVWVYRCGVRAGRHAVGQRNDALEALITEADRPVGCSAAGLARRVNELAAHEGIMLNYDYSAVYRWVRKGECPRAP